MIFPTTYTSFTIPTGAGPGTTRVVLNSQGQLISFYNPQPLPDVRDVFAALWQGELWLGAQTASGNADFSSAGGVVFDASGGVDFVTLRIISPKNNASNNRAAFQLSSGNAAGTNSVFATLTDTLGTKSCNLVISGTIAASDNAGNTLGWQAPSYGTNWSGSTTFNGSINWATMKYRITPFNTVQIYGCFKAGAVVPVNPVFQLTGIYSTTGQWPILVSRNNAGTITTFYAQISAAGNFNIIAATGGGIAANNEYLINTEIPLD